MQRRDPQAHRQRGWELEPLLLSSKLRFPLFQRDLYLTEAVLLMLILHANTAGLLTQLFIVGGGRAALAVMLVA